MKPLALAGLVSTLIAASTLIAQDVPGISEPQTEHEWLQQFLGEWESESEVIDKEGQPSMQCKGTMKYRAIGGLWVVADVKSEIGGFSVTAIQTIGYDSKEKKYIGTWVDSVMNHLWKYEGSVDKSGKILTLEAEGPDFDNPGKTARYRDVYEFKSKDLIELSSQAQGPDGKWVNFMKGNARRKKG